MKPVKGKTYEIIYAPTDIDVVSQYDIYNGFAICTHDGPTDECEVGGLYEFELLSGEDKGRTGLYAEVDIVREINP